MMPQVRPGTIVYEEYGKAESQFVVLAGAVRVSGGGARGRARKKPSLHPCSTLRRGQLRATSMERP
jgi:hypothetical protein